MIRNRSSMRSSRGSNSSTNGSDPREKLKDCCRKFAAFMFTQVGVGALIVTYAVVGAFMFQAIEREYNNTALDDMKMRRQFMAEELWNVVEQYNTLNNTAVVEHYNRLIIDYQNNFTEIIRKGFKNATAEDQWNYSASLMYCLSVFSMIGYGNLVPKTDWGKIMTMIYAAFGIPLYILYFVSMGKVLAATFKWLYTWLHDCSRDADRENLNGSEEGSSLQLPRTKKKIIVPSTACLWVISFYIAGGTIMFAEWEGWNYWDSVYFVVISLCKVGFGDIIPGAGKEKAESSESQSKLVINFIFILFGMGLVAMCYILMREEVREKIREIKEDAKLCMEDVSQKFAKCFGTTNRDEELEERYY